MERIERRQMFMVAGGGATLFCATVWLWRRKVLSSQKLNRPYQLPDDTVTVGDAKAVADPEAELAKIITWAQDVVVRPLDKRLPGQPFEQDYQSFPFTPTVLVIGNHSAGKSTFINRMLGRSAQETGVAPTDDGFTVLQRHNGKADEIDDGPTLLGCPENKPFKELQRFGQSFWGHLRRKRLVLPADTQMPYGLQLIDTPGMIDMPVKSEGAGGTSGGRGYNFLEVVRWFAKRADLILLLFDPEKPGTTGETLDVLTRSLAGLDHKFLIVLNKVDQLDNSVDFARAYGTLGWALSKVIPRKDLPMVYAMYNSSKDEKSAAQASHDKEHKLPLEAFRKKRDEVIEQVQAARVRHWDNVITSFEETLRNLEMVSTVVTSFQKTVRQRHRVVRYGFASTLGLPALAFGKMLRSRNVLDAGLGGLPSWAVAGGCGLFVLASGGVTWILQEYCRQYERLQLAELDRFFEEEYASKFIHTDGEDLRARWVTVKPRIDSMLRHVRSVTVLQPIWPWEVARISVLLSEDLWYLRRLAKQLRSEASA